MTRVDSDAWISKAQKRKAYRDQTREMFFRKLGVKSGGTIDEIAGSPAAQASVVADLLKLTAKGVQLDGNHAAAIQLVGASLAETGLGQGGEMSQIAPLIARMSGYSMRFLRENWFWSPAFFD